jgi:hypothetical protein
MKFGRSLRCLPFGDTTAATLLSSRHSVTPRRGRSVALPTQADLDNLGTLCVGLAARLSVGTAAARGLSPRVEMMTSTGLLLNSFLQGQAVA